MVTRSPTAASQPASHLACEHWRQASQKRGAAQLTATKQAHCQQASQPAAEPNEVTGQGTKRDAMRPEESPIKGWALTGQIMPVGVSGKISGGHCWSHICKRWSHNCNCWFFSTIENTVIQLFVQSTCQMYVLRRDCDEETDISSSLMV